MKKIISVILSAVIVFSVCIIADCDNSKKYLYFNAEGGKSDLSKIIYDENDSIVTGFPSATKEGYNFDGWYENEDYSGNAVTYLIIENGVPETLYAKWTPIEYKINYDYGITAVISDCVENENPDVILYGESVVLKDAVCDGYEFIGWFADENYSEKITEISAENCKDIKLYAKWKICEYSVDYVVVCKDVDLTENDIINNNPTKRNTDENIVLSEPECNIKGYTFAGWYKDDTYTEKVTEIKSYTAENVKLYALWTVNKYCISYNYGVIDTDKYTVNNENPVSYYYGESVYFEDITTDNGAYTFDGWYKDVDFTQKADCISENDYGNVILYAKWKENIFNISYVLTDPDIDINSELVINPNENKRTSVNDFTLQKPVYDRQLYTFDGWYSDKQRTKKIDVISAGTNNNITLYAKWKESDYKITYNYGIADNENSVIVNDNITNYKAGTQYTFKDCSADGFIFNGWFTDSKCKTPINEINESMTGDLTLYADFTEKTYTISYDLIPENSSVNDFEVYSNNVSFRTTTQSVELKDPTTFNVFYTFGGWFADKDYTQSITKIPAFTVGNVTVYAKWIKVITYVPVWGDATLSNGLSAADARLILRYSAKLESLDELAVSVSDVNNDNKVNSTDARLVLRMSAKLESVDLLTQKYTLKSITVQDGKIVFI